MCAEANSNWVENPSTASKGSLFLRFCIFFYPFPLISPYNLSQFLYPFNNSVSIFFFFLVLIVFFFLRSSYSSSQYIYIASVILKISIRLDLNRMEVIVSCFHEFIDLLWWIRYSVSKDNGIDWIEIEEITWGIYSLAAEQNHQRTEKKTNKAQ